MRLGLDLLYLLPGETGGRETYVRSLLPALRDADPSLEFTAFVGPAAREHGLAVERTIVLPASPRSRARWAVGELLLLPRAGGRSGVDLIHSPANFGAPYGPFARVLTIHDLQFLALPELQGTLSRYATAALVRAAARAADRIITGSHTAAREIVARLGIAAERITVVPHGPGLRRSPPTPEGALRSRLGLGDRRILLCPSSHLPHKNLRVLVEVAPQLDALVVLAGHGTEALDGDSVRGVGSVAREDLEGLYAIATGVALPTLYEGFGLPVLEAFERGVPVACSDIPVLREVAGDHALFFDPRSPASVRAALQALLDGRTADPALAIRRAEQFTWAAAAAGTLAVYRETLRIPSRPASASA